jgi:hypothetical protein
MGLFLFPKPNIRSFFLLSALAIFLDSGGAAAPHPRNPKK